MLLYSCKEALNGVGWMLIYPVIEVADLIYAHRYNWLDAFSEVTEGIMIRPEPILGKAFKTGLDLRSYLERYHGVPRKKLAKLKIMLDHGIFTSNFERIFSLKKNEKNIVKVYKGLNVDYGLSFDIPARLYLSIAADQAANIALRKLDLNTATKIVNVIIDPEIKGSLLKLSHEVLTYIDQNIKKLESRRTPKFLRISLRNMGLKIFRRALENPSRFPKLHSLLREFSERAVEVTINRFLKMLEHAMEYGFQGLVPVIQGLFKEHAEHCARFFLNELRRNNISEAMVAIGTGGKLLSNNDKLLIEYIIKYLNKLSRSLSINLKIHILGWSSPRNIINPNLLKMVYSSDSLSARRRAIEGKIYVLRGKTIELIHVSNITSNFSCDCPACRNPLLKTFLLNPSGARRNDVRLVHNVYVLSKYLNSLSS